MPESQDKANLTIDFVGLCAFVADADCRDKTTRVDVLVVDAREAAPDDNLCRHDPLLFFRQDDLVSVDLPEYHHQASWTPGGVNFGVLNLQGRELALDNVDPYSKERLKLTDSYNEVISLDKLTQQTAKVRKTWVDVSGRHEVVSRLRIEHGTLSGMSQSDHRWCLAKPDSDTSSAEFFNFRQIVRWEVFAHGPGAKPYLQLDAGENGWLELKERAHLVISNLCPLTSGGGPEAHDVLAFYAMAEDTVRRDHRLVLHRQGGTGESGGNRVRPGSEACPPVTGFVETSGASS